MYLYHLFDLIVGKLSKLSRFPGVWRIERHLIETRKLQNGLHRHLFGFNWTIEDIGTKNTFLANCERSTSRILFDRACSMDVTFIDVGANRGWYSLLIATASPNSKVLAFEPSSELRMKLESNVKANRLENVVVHPYALGQREKKANLYKYTINDGMNTLFPVEHWGAKMDELIEVRSLDSFESNICEPNLPIIIKLDVEGSEYEVLKGASSLLRTNSLTLIIEINETMLEASGASPAQIFRLLRNHNYAGFWITPWGELRRWDEPNRLPHKGRIPRHEGTNYIFSKI